MSNSVSIEATSERPYVTQLQRGFYGLRFQGGIEEEFADYYRRYCLTHVRFGLAIGAVMMLLSVAMNWWVFAPPMALRMWFSAIVLGGIELWIGILFLYFLRRNSERWLPYLMGAYFIIGAITVVGLRYLYLQHGVYYPFETEIYIFLVLFLMSGIRFRSALWLSLVVVLIAVVGEWLAEGVSSLFAQRLFNTFSISGLAVAGGYSQEYLTRINFLLQRINHTRAERDPLTELLNRRGLAERFSRALQHAKREKRLVGVLAIDLDHFKSYNDLYGHPQGDIALKAIAELLANRVARRPLDCVARLGGEEFAVVWYDVTPQITRSLAEDCLRKIRDLGLKHEGSAFGCVTASIGSVIAPADSNRTAVELLAAADAALYRAKQAGRNRFECELLPSQAAPATDAPAEKTAAPGHDINAEAITLADAPAVAAEMAAAPLKFSMSLPSRRAEFMLELASTPGHFDEVYSIRYRAYRKVNAIVANAEKRFSDSYDENPDTRVFLLRRHGRSVGSLRVLLARPGQIDMLGATKTFREEVEQYVGADRTAIEANRFVVDPDYEETLPPSTRVFLFKGMIVCTHLYDVDFHLGAVRDEHVGFYRRSFQMKPISAPKQYAGLDMTVSLLAGDIRKNYPVICRRFPILNFSATDVQTFTETGAIYF